MIVGNPTIFAIESGIHSAFERLSFRALGMFVLYISGCRYGVYKPDATMLACSLDEVWRRIEKRGAHTAPFAQEPDSSIIIEAFLSANYSDQPKEMYFGMSVSEFQSYFEEAGNAILWAPDGDAAFDDGSFVLQFDVADHVRLIAFKSTQACHLDPITVSDVQIRSEEFYNVLKQWAAAFEADWIRSPKIVSIEET